MISLAGRTALVTGGARGIGRAIAETLVQCGAKVAIADLDLAAAEKTAEEIGEARGFACDVGDPAAVTMLIQTVEDAFGSLDILVNNAGITRDNLMARMKDEDWDAVMAVNLRSAFVAIRAAQRGMMKRRFGRIINIASVVGLMGNKGQANYAASKAGLIGLTKTAAKELASRNILVNAIAPGFIQTAMTDKLPEEAKSALSAQIPLARLGDPKDIANAVAFLASDLASYITGQVLVVDGGMVM
jgi:3-oxoacyl-[acyl-carrier protein] reductase